MHVMKNVDWLFSWYFLEFGGNLNVKAITDFIDAGGNVLVGASSNVGMYNTIVFEIVKCF